METKIGFFSIAMGKFVVPIIEERKNIGHMRGSYGTMMKIPMVLRKVVTELEEADVRFGVGGSRAVDLSFHFFFVSSWS